MFYARHRHNDEENLSITYKKKLVILITLHKVCGRIKNEEEKKKEKKSREQEKKKKFLPTHTSHSFSFLLQKMCPHCTIYRGTGPESNHVRDNKLTFTASPFFFLFSSYHMAQYIIIHIQNMSTRAIQKI